MTSKPTLSDVLATAAAIRGTLDLTDADDRAAFRVRVAEHYTHAKMFVIVDAGRALGTGRAFPANNRGVACRQLADAMIDALTA